MMEEINELEEMRRQLNMLKGRLNKEEIVNDHLLRESFHSKARRINNEAVWSVVCGIFAIIMMWVWFFPRGFSAAFCMGTTILMTGCCIYTILIHRGVNHRAMDGDLLTIAKTMKRVKDTYRKWTKWGITLGILWYGWMVWEIFLVCGIVGDRQCSGFDGMFGEIIQMIDKKVVAISMAAGGAIGAIIGGIIGLRMNKKVMTTCDEVVKSIEMWDNCKIDEYGK